MVWSRACGPFTRRMRRVFQHCFSDEQSLKLLWVFIHRSQDQTIASTLTLFPPYFYKLLWHSRFSCKEYCRARLRWWYCPDSFVSFALNEMLRLKIHQNSYKNWNGNCEWIRSSVRQGHQNIVAYFTWGRIDPEIYHFSPIKVRTFHLSPHWRLRFNMRT